MGCWHKVAEILQKQSFGCSLGIKYLELTVEDGKVRTVKVDMGKPELEPQKIPVKADGDKAVDEPILVGHRRRGAVAQPEIADLARRQAGRDQARIVVEPRRAVDVADPAHQLGVRRIHPGSSARPRSGR